MDMDLEIHQMGLIDLDMAFETQYWMWVDIDYGYGIGLLLDNGFRKNKSAFKKNGRMGL